MGLHVAIVGAGALGVVFGVRLGHGAEETKVSFVVRHQVGARRMRIEQVDRGSALELDAPARVTEVPDDADVVLVCVRFEQVDDALVERLRGGKAPVVIMTPIFPDQHAALEEALGPDRVHPGMPGVVSYRVEPDQGEVETFRYWLPSMATTLIERGEQEPKVIEALAGALNAAGIEARVQPKVHETNLATTFTFVPVMMGIDLAGGIDALLDDDKTLGLVLRAADEARSLARIYGKPAIWADWFVRFASPRSLLGVLTPKSMVGRSLRMAVGFARRRSPEAVRYVEEHFGHKLRTQNLLMAEKMVDLFRGHARPHEAMTDLRDRLRALSSPPPPKSGLPVA